MEISIYMGQLMGNRIKTGDINRGFLIGKEAGNSGFLINTD